MPLGELDLSRIVWPNAGTLEQECKAVSDLVYRLLSQVLQYQVARIVTVTNELREPMPYELLSEMTSRAAKLNSIIDSPERAADIWSEVLQLLQHNDEAIRNSLRLYLPQHQRGLLYRYIVDGFGEVNALLRYRLSEDFDSGLHVLTSLGAAEGVRRAAAERLADTKFKSPVSAQRWNGHKSQIREAIRERQESADSLGQPTNRDAIIRELIVAGLTVIGLESNQIQTHVTLRVNGTTYRVANPPFGIIPRMGLPVRHFEAWFRSRVADWLMDELVPDWREQERRWRYAKGLSNRGTQKGGNDEDDRWLYLDNVVEISLDALRATDASWRDPDESSPLDALVATESSAAERFDLAKVIQSASAQQKEIIDTMRLLIEHGYLEHDHGIKAATASVLGIPPSQVRKQLERVREQSGQKKKPKKKPK